MHGRSMGPSRGLKLSTVMHKLSLDSDYITHKPAEQRMWGPREQRPQSRGPTKYSLCRLSLGDEQQQQQQQLWVKSNEFLVWLNGKFNGD